jgi:hypothetical protein
MEAAPQMSNVPRSKALPKAVEELLLQQYNPVKIISRNLTSTIRCELYQLLYPYYNKRGLWPHVPRIGGNSIHSIVFKISYRYSIAFIFSFEALFEDPYFHQSQDPPQATSNHHWAEYFDNTYRGQTLIHPDIPGKNRKLASYEY